MKEKPYPPTLPPTHFLSLRSVVLGFVLLLMIAPATASAQILDHSWNSLTLQEESDWFGSKEAYRIAENVVLYQRNIGGWPKNIPMHHPLSDSQTQQLMRLKSSNEGVTTDNNATCQEMLFLSKVYRKQPDPRFKTAFLDGLNYLLAAQYENGGWPQYYPLRNGYYSHITFNDDSMVNILRLLKELKDQTDYYAITPDKQQLQQIEQAFQKGIDCILKTQYRQNGILTAWCAQHDAKTLQPAKARAYELPSLSGAESANILTLLMSIQNPSQEVIEAVQRGVAWLDRAQIRGLRQDLVFNEKGQVVDKVIVPDAQAPPMWARFYDLTDNTPFFCDREGIKRRALHEIDVERRLGYAWYKHFPESVLAAYPLWEQENIPNRRASGDLYHMVISKDGTGDFSSVQEAINHAKAFPYDRITLFIKKGIYREKVKIHEWNPNLTLVGESKTETVITYDDYFDQINLGRNSTFYTPTVLVEANDVVLKNLTIENSAGPVGQAIALAVTSNRVAVVNCKLVGNQDTLYASGTGKQYYKDCDIEGTTDFIFGSATALFESCRLHSRSDSYITAASTPLYTAFGFVFKNCVLTAEPGVQQVYLGRPWRNYAKTVFMQCRMDSHIVPSGWDNWSRPEAETTVFYAEFENYGSGYMPSKRPPWTYQLNELEAQMYSRNQILGKNEFNSNRHWYENLD